MPASDDSSLQPDGWRSDAYSAWSNRKYEPFELNSGRKEEERGVKVLTMWNLIPQVAFSMPGRFRRYFLLPPKLVLAVGEPNPVSDDSLIRFNDPSAIAGILILETVWRVCCIGCKRF